MQITINPSRYDLLRLLAEAPGGNVRALRAPNGRVYAWPAEDARHIEVAATLDLPFETRAHLQAASYLFNSSDVEAAGDFTDFEDLVSRLARG